LLLLLVVAIGVIFHRRKQGGPAGARGHHEDVLSNPMYEGRPEYNIPNIPPPPNDHNEEDYAVLGSTLSPQGEAGPVVYSSDMPIAAVADADSDRSTRIPSYAAAVGPRGGGGGAANFYEVMAPGHAHEQPTAGGNGNNEYDVGAPIRRPSAGAGGAAAASQFPNSSGVPNRCQRPSPKGGTCKNKATTGSQFCKGHTCLLDGCSEGKSSAAATCFRHSALERASGTGVDAAGTGGGGGSDYYESYENDAVETYTVPAEHMSTLDAPLDAATAWAQQQAADVVYNVPPTPNGAGGEPEYATGSEPLATASAPRKGISRGSRSGSVYNGFAGVGGVDDDDIDL
jgi:hypothetical protein